MPKQSAAAVLDAPPLTDDPRDVIEQAKRLFVDSMEPGDDEDEAQDAADRAFAREVAAEVKARAPDFALEPPIEPGKVPKRVIDELCTSFRIASDYAGAFSDALRAQAEKFKIHPKALRRYVVALEGDKTADARKELDDLERLLDGAGVVDATITVTQ